MVDCPECGKEMRVSGYIGPELVYNCDDCAIDCYKPPKKIEKQEKVETKKTTRKTKSKKIEKPKGEE